MNDWDPRFRYPQYDFFVSEAGIEPGAVVGRIEAADGDRGDYVSLELRGPAAVLFDINNDGEIILLDTALLNTSTAHMVIVATDNGVPPRQVSLGGRGSVHLKLSFTKIGKLLCTDRKHNTANNNVNKKQVNIVYRLNVFVLL